MILKQLPDRYKQAYSEFPNWQACLDYLRLHQLVLINEVKTNNQYARRLLLMTPILAECVETISEPHISGIVATLSEMIADFEMSIGVMPTGHAPDEGE